ncbi:MAG: carotenoid oxygenase family protein, partial [Halieaceae bacterium]|nr:carotenoid oxygenase family protein [Halieaceae bacterium]
NIVLDVCRLANMIADGIDTPAFMTRWVINRSSGTVKETQIDDRNTEFPRLPDRLVGQKHRYGYTAGLAASAPYGERYIKYDFGDFSAKTLELGAGRQGSEAVFVPDPSGSGEDDGWLLAYVYDQSTDCSEVLILDASTLSEAARVLLPARVPMGFHGSWVPA